MIFPSPLVSTSAITLLAILPAARCGAQQILLSPVVVTAHHADRPLVITADPQSPAQPMPVQDGAELLRGIAGFSVIRKGGSDGDPVLRGMAGSRLGILADGNVILGGCGNRMDPPTAYVHPAAFDRVTVLKGPQSVVDGPGYSAGVVRFERDPDWAMRHTNDASGSITLGSFGRNDQAARLRAVVRPAFVEANVTRSASRDYEDGKGAAVHSGYERWNAQTAVAWATDAQTVIELTAARGDGEASYADRAMDGAKFARENLALGFTRQVSGAVLQRLEARAYLNAVDHVMDNYTQRVFRPSAAMPNPSVSNPDRRTRGGRLLANGRVAGTTVDTGIDFQSNRHRIRSTENAAIVAWSMLPRTDDAKFDQTGVFAELAHPWSEHGRWIAGGRLDRWRMTDHRATIASGMAGTTPNPTAGQHRHEALGSGFFRLEHEHGRATAYAGIGYASRFPDYWEVFSKENAASVSAFATEPERTAQLDAGVIVRGRNFSASVSTFASRIDDYILIQSGVRKGMRTATISRNVDARTWGGEATTSVRFGGYWRADASLTYVRGDNLTDHRPLAQQPPLEGRLALAYAGVRWSAGAVGRWVAAQHRVAPNQGNIAGQDIATSDAFAVAALNAGWSFHRHARVTAGIDNIFDRAYAEHLSRSGSSIPGYVQVTRVMEPGRMIWMKLDLRY
ncbi:MAG: TonB-dependent copper receptor [Opitutaceae bacterium]|nr:TonB-dependent copper receptor [Opitutaceae bacterium]